MSKLIGTTEFELTDIKTGEKRTYTEKNMFTNRLNKILSKNPYGAIRGADLMPLADSLLGSIILFPNTQTENAENDILFNSEVITGKKAASSSDKTNNGHKFVFDFSAEEGNGTIASVSLTGNTAGAIAQNDSNMLYDVNGEPIDGFHAYDEKTGTYYYLCFYEYGRDLSIMKIKNNPYKIGLGDKFRQVTEVATIPCEYIMTADEIIEIEGEGDISGKPKYNYYIGDSYSGYINSVSLQYEGDTPYIYVFSIRKPDTTDDDFYDNPILHISKFNMKTNDLDDYKEIELQNPMNMGTIAGCSRYGSFVKDFWLFKNNYLYIWWQSYEESQGTGSISKAKFAYKHNINDETDIIELGVIGAGLSAVMPSSGLMLNNEYGWSYSVGDFAIENDVIYKNGDLWKHLSARPNITFDDTYGFFDNANGSQNIILMANYKATINNLETPIVKTVNDVLKITYTITEVENS